MEVREAAYSNEFAALKKEELALAAYSRPYSEKQIEEIHGFFNRRALARRNLESYHERSLLRKMMNLSSSNIFFQKGYFLLAEDGSW